MVRRVYLEEAGLEYVVVVVVVVEPVPVELDKADELLVPVELDDGDELVVLVELDTAEELVLPVELDKADKVVLLDLDVDIEDRVRIDDAGTVLLVARDVFVV